MAYEASAPTELCSSKSASEVCFFGGAVQIALLLFFEPKTKTKKKKNSSLSYPPSGPDATRAAKLEPLGLVPLPGLGLFFSPAISGEEKRGERGGEENEK